MHSTRPPYTPQNWYWTIGGDETRAWSSAARDYVAEWPEDHATRIANEVELYEVLARVGMANRAPSRAFTIQEVRDALLAIDAGATGEANDADSLRAVAADMGFILPTVIE